jgi:tetratricopeptide (TPR) repeat protein
MIAAMKRQALAGLLALLAAAVVARAQGTCTALGMVVDKDGQPIPDVQVLMEYKGHIPQKYRTKTDKKGRFMHVNVYEGAYKITFSKEGYGEASLETSVREIASTEKPPEYHLAKKALEAPAPPPSSGASSRIAPADAVALIQSSAELLKAGKLDEAEAAYAALIEKAPQVPDLHFNMALVQEKKHDVAKAEASFRKAVELDPKFADAWSGLAMLLIENGKAGQAVEALGQGVAANPEDKKLLLAQAVTCLNLGRADEAQAAFLKLESLDPGNAEIQYHLATLALNRSKKDDAVARLEKYLAMAPADAPNAATAKAILAALKKGK